MSQQDIQAFVDAVARLKAQGNLDIPNARKPAEDALTRLSMPDMLAAFEAVGEKDGVYFGGVGLGSRTAFAFVVVSMREIKDLGVPADQVNDARRYLGCTPLDDAEVKNTIEFYYAKAKTFLDGGNEIEDRQWPRTPEASACCMSTRVAWMLLAEERRKVAGNSLISNLAAAAHYMLCRFHVCAALASKWQMGKVVERYDEKKREAVWDGDRNLSSMALNKGNPPFPVDFAITAWALKGAVDGNTDHARCNSKTSFPILFPDIEDNPIEGKPKRK